MKITKTQLKEIIKEEIERSLEEDEGAEGGLYDIYPKSSPPAPENPDADRNKEELVSDLFRRLRDALEVKGLHDDEIRSAVEEALNAALSLNPGEVMAHAGLASDRYEREERAIRRAGPKGRIPFDPSLYDED